MVNDHEAKNDLFQYWLMEMGDILDRFIEKMPKELELDFSPESLLRIEGWILENYATVGDILKESEKSLLDSLARYVGEVYRRNLNGKWKLYLDDPDNVFYELPVIIVPNGKVPVICPLTEVTASVDRRKGDYIYNLFQKKLKRISQH
ncbi:hypothetical protein [Thermoactinomyces sp. CICC 10521]|uniref:hypothetical protein n=1 Tax=Thermoactinomyces sp. CICC 10521 TaxID=2767426 RepID=UPI0018DD1800|nr:hypothetical protein [Thermoactinomyces sp. CICC 10521]MBH8609261.1 hypothetical protein [Thermoactinomyces sp. CICC 10521]